MNCNDLKIVKTTIEVGLKKPIKLLHITDSHIFRDDTTGWNRKKDFDVDFDGCTETYFLKALEYAKTNNLPIIHTGDIIDFFSEGNFNFLGKYFTKDIDYIYAAGNHDFVDFNDIKKGKQETKEYKEKQISAIAPFIKNNLYFYSRVIGGVNIVALDDSYYQISEGQIDMLKAEVAKGYPIILCMHVPFFGPDSATRTASGKIVLDVAVPESVIETYPIDRQLQIRPDNATLKAVDYIKNEPMIKALLTGHHHYNVVENLETGLLQIMTAGSFYGYVREITVL